MIDELEELGFNEVEMWKSQKRFNQRKNYAKLQEESFDFDMDEDLVRNRPSINTILQQDDGEHLSSAWLRPVEERKSEVFRTPERSSDDHDEDHIT